MATNEIQNGCESSIEAVLASNHKRRCGYSPERRRLSSCGMLTPSVQWSRSHHGNTVPKFELFSRWTCEWWMPCMRGVTSTLFNNRSAPTDSQVPVVEREIHQQKGLYEGTAAGGAGARSATEAVVARRDGAAFEPFGIEVPKEERHSVFPRHPELLVEVAVIDFALPTYAQGIFAHQAIDRGGVERFDHQLHISVQLTAMLEPGGKAPDGHISESVEPVKIDVEVLLQLPLVVCFKLCLVGREKVTVGIVYKVQRKVSHSTVTKAIQELKGAYAGIKDAIAALGIDVVERVTRHRGNDFHAVSYENVGQPLIT